jgi:hypothetical protein
MIIKSMNLLFMIKNKTLSEMRGFFILKLEIVLFLVQIPLFLV